MLKGRAKLFIMKAFEMPLKVGQNGELKVPESISKQLTPGQSVRLLLLVEEDSESKAWSRLGAEQFLAGYDEADAIYDTLE